MIAQHLAFDVQLSLARVTRLRVDTRRMTHDQVEYVIGYKWMLVLDEDEFDQLARDTESDFAFREVLDRLKPSCLTFNSFLATR